MYAERIISDMFAAADNDNVAITNESLLHEFVSIPAFFKYTGTTKYNINISTSVGIPLINATYPFETALSILLRDKANTANIDPNIRLIIKDTITSLIVVGNACIVLAISPGIFLKSKYFPIITYHLYTLVCQK
jgi:hypothetical protein